MLFTTSWDDGHPLDLRVAELLERYGFTGTFYVCKEGYDRQTLSPDQIRSLSSRHEIGAHTLTHPDLTALSASDLRHEIIGSKKWVEGITGTECAIFAYPFGYVNDFVRIAVETAGFRGARTTEDLSWDDHDSFLLPTSVQVHMFPIRPVMNRRIVQPVRELWPQLRACGISIIACRSWLSMAKAVFRYAQTSGKPWFHLWGHSWSLEKFGLWGNLEQFLQFVRGFEDVQAVTNIELISSVPSAAPSTK